MNNSKKSETTVACAGDMDIDKNNMLELKSPIITMSKKEMDKQLDTIMLSNTTNVLYKPLLSSVPSNLFIYTSLCLSSII